jgi:hypothetical protein
MSIIVYIFLLVFFLILFILFTAIGVTFKLKVLSLKKRKEFGGTFTIKWLLFSHTFLIEKPKAEKPSSEELDKSIVEKERVKTEDWREEKEFKEKPEEKGEKEIIVESEEKKVIKDKKNINSKKEGEKKVNIEQKVEPKKGMTTIEKFHWGLEAFRSLRNPLVNLFSDLLNGIKIKRLESCVTFGLSDPADTGVLCGFIHSIAGFIYSRCSYCSFSVNPIFMDPMLDFRGNAEVRVRIYSMIFPFIKFVFNKNTLSFTYSVVKELLQQKWESELKPKWKSKWKSKWKFNS